MQIKKLVKCDGVSGYENEVRKVIIDSITDFVDEIYTDNIGNITAIKKGIYKKNKKKILIITHMDEVGIQITSIKNDGKVKFKALGSLKVSNLHGQRIKLSKDLVGLVVSELEFSNIDTRDTESLSIDFGFNSKKDAMEYIDIGAVGVFLDNYIENESTIISKAIDNRVSCSLSIKLIEELQEFKNDIYFTFTVQEEIGLKGAKVVGNKINPDIGIVIDTIDIQNVNNIELGEGPAIKISDSLTICDSDIVNDLKTICHSNGINYQLEVSDVGGTELFALEELGKDIKCAAISIPVKYSHTSSSIIKKSDVHSSYELIKAFLSKC